jgi:hypothetical protein
MEGKLLKFIQENGEFIIACLMVAALLTWFIYTVVLARWFIIGQVTI